MPKTRFFKNTITKSNTFICISKQETTSYKVKDANFMISPCSTSGGSYLILDCMSGNYEYRYGMNV